MQSQPVFNPLLAHHQAQIETFCFFQIVKDRNSDIGQKPNGNPQRGLSFDVLHKSGGGERDRTDDLLLAKQALSQLSYTPGLPTRVWWVWLDSNQRPPPYQDGALTS
jgi:hypothetical protein